MKNFLFSYLKFWASGYLKRTDPEIIAITGSVGKTSAKEAIFEVLRAHFKDGVRKSAGNLNNETGVPLAILNYQNSPVNSLGWIPILISAPIRSLIMKKTKILVLEYAADKPGDIKYLTTFTKPHIAVLTTIGVSHLEAFGEIANIIEEKANLLRALTPDDFAVLNIDDENIRKLTYGGKYHKISYALKDADITAEDIKTKIEKYLPQTTFKIKTEKNTIDITQNTLGKSANVYASLAAAAVAQVYEITPNEIRKGLNQVKPEIHRLNVLQGKNQSIIIDDSYNASPASMKAALEILKNLPFYGKKYAVLGDMLEIGKVADESHREIGKLAASIADVTVSVGQIAIKFNAKNHFKNYEEAARFLLPKLTEGDIILIKGSRKVALDKLVDILKKKQ